MNIIVNLPKLTTYAQAYLGQHGQIETLEISSLNGGYSDGELYRLDVRVGLAHNVVESIPLTQKWTTAREVRVMQTLHQHCPSASIPPVIDCSIDPAGSSWFIMPYYAGEQLTFEDEIPTAIIDALACIHGHFASRLDQIDWLPRLDVAFMDSVFDHALRVANEVLPQVDDIRLQLNQLRANPLFIDALNRLPRTLTHGDVNPENIIQLPDDQAILIDWGNARIAPAMFDLANMIEIDSPNWSRYLNARSAYSNVVVNPAKERRGYYWATALLNVYYLPYAIQYDSLDHVYGMLARIRASLNQIDGII